MASSSVLDSPFSFQASHSEHEIHVLIIGLDKTGKSYVNQALEYLYGKPCFSLSHLVYKRRQLAQKWLDLCVYCLKANSKLDHHLIESDVYKLLKDYQLVSGPPASLLFEQLLKIYPNMKVILTVRNSEIWLAVCRSEFLAKNKVLSFSWFRQKYWDIFSSHSLKQLQTLSTLQTLGELGQPKNDRELLNAAVRWNNNVTNKIPAENLLVFNVKEGWGPLCKFLRFPQPQMPFPGIQSPSYGKLLSKAYRHYSNMVYLVLYFLAYSSIFYMIFKYFTA